MRLPTLAALLLVLIAAAPATRPTTKPLLTYQLADGSEKWPADKRAEIVKAMDAAVAVYNANGTFDRHLTANYSPGTPTADGNYSGWINFGGQIGERVAVHEIAHTLGVGTTRQWHELSKDGVWTGPAAVAELKKLDGEKAVLHSDQLHFWPYGLNYDREGGPQNEVRCVKMVAALRRDMGLDKPRK